MTKKYGIFGTSEKEIALRELRRDLLGVFDRRGSGLPQWETKRGLSILDKVEVKLTKAREEVAVGDFKAARRAHGVAVGCLLEMEEYNCAFEILKGVRSHDPGKSLYYMRRLWSARYAMRPARSKKILYGPDTTEVVPTPLGVKNHERVLEIVEAWAKGREAKA